MNTVEEVKNKLILYLKLNKLETSGIFPPILLNELLLNKNFSGCKVKQGFISMNNEGHCWHLWIENGEDIIDINQDIARSMNDDFKHVKFDLSTEPPLSGNYDKDDTNVSHWELYNEDKRKFWKEQPMKYQNFRGKVLHKLFKNNQKYD